MAQTAQHVLTAHPELQRLGGVPSLRRYLSDLWRWREFAVTVPMGEVRSRHMNTVLGSAWHLLNPLLLAGVYYVIFGVILNARRGISNYPAFLIIGIFVFYYTQKSLQSGARTIVSNFRLLNNLTFPRAILPVSAVISESLTQIPAIAAMLLIVLVTGETPTLGWLLIAPAFVLQAAFNFGIAFFAGRATFHFRDVQQVLPYVTRIWLYLSGIFYAASRVPDGWARTVFELNPLYLMAALARNILLEGGASLKLWVANAVWAIAMLLAGFFFFRGGEGAYGRGW